MVIYKTTNLINGKFYIGKDAKNKDSYYGSGIILNKAIKKYGKDNFKKEILEECLSLEELADKEVYWIDKLSATTIGYNIALGGLGGCLGCKASEETRRKMSESFKDRVFSKEHKIKLSESAKGRYKSEEHKKKLSESLKKKYVDGWICPSLGIKRSEETKNKISDSLKGGDGRNKKSITIEGVEYETIKDASETLGISRYLIRKIYFNKD
jgi:group I intron endonuclease